MYAVKRTYRRNNSESVCRLCSSNSGIIVLNIFDDEGKKRRILSLINACLPVKVSENDPLPKVICHHCLHKLEVFREFQKSCLKSEETLRNGVTCSVTFPAFRNASQEYVQEHEEMVSQFSAELLPIQEPLSHHQSATVVATPTEEGTEECTAAIRRDGFEHSQSDQLEVIMVKEEPEEKSIGVNEDSKWYDTKLEEDNTVETEQSEFDLVPPDDEIKSEVCASIEPPVIRLSHGDQSQQKRGWTSMIPPHRRLSGRHFAGRIPAIGKKSKPQKRCVVCYKHGKRRESIFWCTECKTGLCLDPCFMIYHTLEHF